MARRDAPGTDAPAPPFNSPFRDLGKRLGPLPERAKGAPRAGPPAVDVPSPAAPAAAENEAELFRDAVRGAVPIPPSARDRAAATLPRSPPRGPVGEDEAALAELNDLVAGVASFDISDTEEHVEGMVVGLDPRVLRRLRAGELAHHAHLDLHGMTAEEAKLAVREFVLRSMVVGRRCVLIVHGRGRNSPDQRPVLKDRLKHWLTHGELGRRVLAFSSARPYDGGSGAMYVLLRRERRGKKPFRTLDGAKS
jgi:DNA-nicking Smr family endonuclease